MPNSILFATAKSNIETSTNLVNKSSRMKRLHLIFHWDLGLRSLTDPWWFKRELLQNAVQLNTTWYEKRCQGTSTEAIT